MSWSTTGWCQIFLNEGGIWNNISLEAYRRLVLPQRWRRKCLPYRYLPRWWIRRCCNRVKSQSNIENVFLIYNISCRTEVMRPQWFSVTEDASEPMPGDPRPLSSIPYNQLWETDPYWLPMLLSNTPFHRRADFKMNSEKSKLLPYKWWFGALGEDLKCIESRWLMNVESESTICLILSKTKCGSWKEGLGKVFNDYHTQRKSFITASGYISKIADQR